MSVRQRGRLGQTDRRALPDALEAATGWELTTEDVEEIGERIYTLERTINVERGIASRETDTLPHRVMHEPIPDSRPPACTVRPRNSRR